VGIRQGHQRGWQDPHFAHRCNVSRSTCRSDLRSLILRLLSQSRALGQTQDLDIAKETLDYMWTEAKDQDFHYFFFGLSNNTKTKRLLRSYVFENYDKVL
jgi:hypothetical protein